MGNSQCCSGDSSSGAHTHERGNWSQRPSPRAALDGLQGSGNHSSGWMVGGSPAGEVQRQQQHPGARGGTTASTQNPLSSPAPRSSNAREDRMAQLREEAEARAAQTLSLRGVRRASPPRNGNAAGGGGTRYQLQPTAEPPLGEYGALQTVDPPAFQFADDAPYHPSRSQSEDNFSLASAGSSLRSLSHEPEASQLQPSLERRNMRDTVAPETDTDPMESEAASSQTTNSVLEHSFEASIEQHSPSVPLTRKNSFDQYLLEHVRQVQQTRKPLWFRGSARSTSLVRPSAEQRFTRNSIRFDDLVDSALGDEAWRNKRANAVGLSDSPDHLVGTAVMHRVQLAKKLTAVGGQEFAI